MPHEHSRGADGPHCSAHSGMIEKDNTQLIWIKLTFAVMSAGLTIASVLLVYSVFWQSPSIKTSIMVLQEQINGMKSVDNELGRRVSNLEATVYKSPLRPQLP